MNIIREFSFDYKNQLSFIKLEEPNTILDQPYYTIRYRYFPSNSVESCKTLYKPTGSILKEVRL